MRIFVNGLAGTDRFDSMPAQARANAMRNARTIEALSLSSDPFPVLAKEALSQLHIPVLVVTGANTIRIHKRVNEELIRLLPNARGVTIPGAGHGSPRDNSAAFNQAMLAFFQTDGQSH